MPWLVSARKNYALNPSSDLEVSASGQHSWVFAQIIALGPVKKKKGGEKMLVRDSVSSRGRQEKRHTSTFFLKLPFFGCCLGSGSKLGYF